VTNDALAHPGLRTIEEWTAGEPDWLREARAEAFRAFDGAAPPDRALHRWRYAEAARLMPGDRPLAPAAFDPGGIVLDPEAERAGVVAIDLSRAAAERPEAVRAALGRLVAAGESPFAALNAALWTGGLFVEVPPGVRLTRPIVRLRRYAGSGVVLPRTLCVLGAGSEAVFIDEQLAAEGAGADAPLVHRTLEWVVGDGARLTLVTLQDLPSGASGTTTARVRLGRGAALDAVFTAFGGAATKSDLAVELAGEGARAEVRGVVFGTGRQQFDHHAVLEHLAPRTASRLDLRVALRDRARSAFTGMLRIAHEAVHSEAFQENRNLLLHETAHAVSIPELEILTDEVQASHGATVGPIDEDQLFYLAARGLPRPEAERMVVGGFFEPLLARIPDDGVREEVRGRVEARLAR
jgi:Fe-S cluster assembly protein SufD